MLIYRLCKQRYSAAVLSGVGGLHADGRWNTPGNPIVYCASSESLAVLELRVHVGNYLPRDTFVMHEIALDETLIDTLKPKQLPNGWHTVPHSLASQRIGDDWLKSQRSLALKVPSIHSSTEFNVLINPTHPAHEQAKVKRAWDYAMDARLFAIPK